MDSTLSLPEIGENDIASPIDPRIKWKAADRSKAFKEQKLKLKHLKPTTSNLDIKDASVAFIT